MDGVLSGGEYRCDVSNRAGNGSFQATLNGNVCPGYYSRTLIF